MQYVGNAGSESGLPFQPAMLFTGNRLTKREAEVLCLMADGLTTKDIATRLGITFKTAACHRSRVLQKLGVDSTVTVVRWAIREGLIKP